MRVNALILWVSDVEQARAFYTALGLELAHEQHGSGPVHYTMKVQGVHFALFASDDTRPAPGYRETGGTLFGFEVADIASAISAATQAGGSVVRGPEDAPWGRRVILADPDGRPVELTQAK